MSITGLFKKASSLLGFSPNRGGDASLTPPLDGEIIYCKNNVCVHPPAVLSTQTEHHPGYLNIRSQDDKVLGSTLILTWIPNSTLQHNPRSIENSPARISPRRSPKQEYTHTPTTPTERLPSPTNASLAKQVTSSSSSGNGSYSASFISSGGISLTSCSSGYGTEQSQSHTDITETTNSENSSSVTTQSTCSSDSPMEDDTAERLLFLQMSNEKGSNQGRVLRGNMEKLKERNSSSKSVTSIEMEGDSLMVVTEEVEVMTLQNGSGKEEDDIFQDEAFPKSAVPTCPIVVSASQKCPEEVDKLKSSLDLNLPVKSAPLSAVAWTDVKNETGSSISSSITSGPDSCPPSPPSPAAQSPPPEKDTGYATEVQHIAVKDLSSPGQPPNVIFEGCPNSPTLIVDRCSGDGCASGSGSPTLLHDMTFPQNSCYSEDQQQDAGTPSSEARHRTAKEQLCGVFSVDLGQMRFLRVFFSRGSSGQLVIASRESQYKVLHFHHGGLDKLSEVFDDWKFLALPVSKNEAIKDVTRQYSVIRPYLPDEQYLHPEEGGYETVNEETWRMHMNDQGQIMDHLTLRKAIFFAGLDSTLRHEMWPFLLHYYPYLSTVSERDSIRNDRYIQYQNIRKKRESMSEAEYRDFFRSIQCIVEKDVVRTDRSNPYFKGENNPNIEVLKNILLNYAVMHPQCGYTQGMSDLLAPVLAEVKHEADAYWCFVGLMQKTIFVSSPKDNDMDRQLNYLKELLRLLLKRFYQHINKMDSGMELLFVHRWILLCFKREFPEGEALRIWESCWSHYQTDFFHLFVCVAIISVYGEDVVDQNLAADEMLLHFSSLAMHMNGEVILKKARGLLHQFRLLSHIPCELHDLCVLCGPGMWDSGHVPKIKCTGHHGDVGHCPYGGTKPWGSTVGSGGPLL